MDVLCPLSGTYTAHSSNGAATADIFCYSFGLLLLLPGCASLDDRFFTPPAEAGDVAADVLLFALAANADDDAADVADDEVGCDLRLLVVFDDGFVALGLVSSSSFGSSCFFDADAAAVPVAVLAAAAIVAPNVNGLSDR